MKNQGIWITRILSIALGLFIFAYMGYHILRLFDESVATVTATLKTTTLTQSVDGVVARDEKTVTLPVGLLEFSAAEAERVSKGQTLAVYYHSAETQQKSRDLKTLIERRDLLDYISLHGTALTDVGETDAQIRRHMAEMLEASDDGRMASAADISAQLKILVFRQAYSYDGTELLEPMLMDLNGQIEALSSSVVLGSEALRADEPGLFSSVNDGLEDVWTMEALEEMSLTEYNELIQHKAQTPSSSLCRLVRDWTWYYVFTLPSAQANSLPQTVELLFPNDVQAAMNKHYVSLPEDGTCVVVLTSAREISRFLSTRTLNAEIIRSNYSGVRIPENGLRIDEEGQRYVYCDVLGKVVRKNVRVIDELEQDNYYLCEYKPEDKSALLPGDEIIVSGKGLYDGKILKN